MQPAQFSGRGVSGRGVVAPPLAAHSQTPSAAGARCWRQRTPCCRRPSRADGAELRLGPSGVGRRDSRSASLAHAAAQGAETSPSGTGSLTRRRQAAAEADSAPTWSGKAGRLAGLAGKKKRKAAKPGAPRDDDMEAEENAFDPGTRSSSAQMRPFDGFDDEEGDKGGNGTHKRLPVEMRCFDTAKICIKSGDGGHGCVAMRREKFVEFGGPAGGNGGRGGNVWAEVDVSCNSLTGFRRRVHWRAPNGTNGLGSSMHGANADDLVIPVPAGTILRRAGASETDTPLAELISPGDRALLLVGGRGGRGNESFKTHSNNAPAFAERGEEGLETWVDLELKVVADVGIIGVPNAGKSTLLSVLTSAKPKIANYPFTTLVPNLGVCEMDYDTTVFADVPGLLEGAHEGLGLGHEFLRHVQRCRVLVHVIDGTSPDPMGDFRAINLELELFNPALKDKHQVVAYNKIDVPDSGDFADLMKDELMAEGVDAADIFAVSAATGQGVLPVVRRVRQVLAELGPPEAVYETDAANLRALPAFTEQRLDEFTIEVETPSGPEGPKYFYVEGDALQRFAQMTNWDYYEAVKRFQKVLSSSGVNGALKARGVQEGDTVVIGESEFEWQDDQSDSALYSAFKEDMRARGRNVQGSSHWPKSV